MDGAAKRAVHALDWKFTISFREATWVTMQRTISSLCVGNATGKSTQNDSSNAARRLGLNRALFDLRAWQGPLHSDGRDCLPHKTSKRLCTLISQFHGFSGRF
jgi:hypothetical protein